MVAVRTVPDRGRHFGDWLVGQSRAVATTDARRLRAATTCLTLAVEYHAAIVVLLQRGLTSAAGALRRVQFESLVRGTWLLDSPPDPHDDADVAARGDDLRAMIRALETVDAEFGRFLASTLDNVLGTERTADDGIVVDQQFRDDVVASTPDRELRTALRADAEFFALLAGAQIARIQSD